jgi:hypothetical protein
MIDQALDYISRFMALDTPERRAARTRREPLFLPRVLTFAGAEPPFHHVCPMEGPVGIVPAARQIARETPNVDAVVLYVDDVIEIESVPARRVRLLAQRRGMPAAAIIDRPYVTPTAEAAFGFAGPRTFTRWTDSLFE